jgi:hypothetical protein
MRTTVRMDDGLLAEAKQFAARTGRTLTAVIEDAVRQFLAGGKRSSGRSPVALPRFRGRGLQAGVDLDDGAALLERMESR